jgi:hypothetical protein
VRVLDAPPVYGALAEALREVGAGAAACRRARDCLIGGPLAVACDVMAPIPSR